MVYFPQVCTQSGYLLTLNKYSQTADCHVCSPVVTYYLLISACLTTLVNFYLEICCEQPNKLFKIKFECCVFFPIGAKQLALVLCCHGKDLAGGVQKRGL